MDLRGQEIKNTYGNVVTVGSSAGAPTTGELTNGQNTSFTSTYLGGNFGIGSAPTTYGSLNVLALGSAGSAGGAIIDIVGTSGRLASIYTEASGKLVFTADPTNGEAGTSMEFNVDGSNAIFIDSSLRVGIGTTLPAQKLDVSGTVSADRYLSTSSSASLPSFGVSSGNGIYLAGANIIGFSTNSTERVRIDASGNVGIGTSSPSQKLHIDGSVRITGAIYDSNNAAGTSGQVLSSTGTGTDWVSLSEISGVDGTGTANYISKWSDTDTITDSQIQDDGTTVGVGQAPSTAKLTVSGDIQTAAPETTTASAWKLGTTNLGGVFVATADYVTVEVNGFIVKLPIAIAPDTQDYYDRVISDGGSFEGVLSYESATTILKSN
jgi:trimeric autotransporter adhesin